MSHLNEELLLFSEGVSEWELFLMGVVFDEELLLFSGDFGNEEPLLFSDGVWDWELFLMGVRVWFWIEISFLLFWIMKSFSFFLRIFFGGNY